MIRPPTLRDWTQAHAEPDTLRRLRAIQFLHDRMRASHMGPLHAWLYLHRHAFGFALILACVLGYAWLNGWLGWVVGGLFLASILVVGERHG